MFPCLSYLSCNQLLPDTPYIQSLSNHPVHVKDSLGKMNPSAFIPFCEFGGNMSVMGETIDQFEFPVCNKFKPRVLGGQLCYYVDVNEFKDQVQADKIKNGLIMLIDYNEERMLTEKTVRLLNPNATGLQDILKEKDNLEDAMIHINSLGRSSDIHICRKLDT